MSPRFVVALLTAMATASCTSGNSAVTFPLPRVSPGGPGGLNGGNGLNGGGVTPYTSPGPSATSTPTPYPFPTGPASPVP